MTSFTSYFIQVILLDYSKAFDHIDPNVMLRKLENMHIPDYFLRWVESFLMDRRERVKIGQNLSEWLEV